MKNRTKDLILEVAIELIKENDENTKNITIRDISERAGIAVSQINYHFQTKENLIAECVQKMISSIIEKFAPCLEELSSKNSFERLEAMVNLTYRFLYENENLARISILRDHNAPSLTDNTAQTMKCYRPLIEAICTEREITNPLLKETLLIQSLQGTFLRTDTIKNELGIDLRNSIEREKFLHEVLESFFAGK